MTDLTIEILALGCYSILFLCLYKIFKFINIFFLYIF